VSPPRIPGPRQLLEGWGLARREPIRTALAVWDRASEDAVGPLAAGLAYFAFLSIFPLLLIGLSVIGFVLGDEAVRSEWAERLTEAVPGLQDFASRNLRALVDGRAATGVVGLLGALWTGSGIARAADLSLARIFRIEIRSAVRQRFRALATASGLGVLALVSVGVPGFVTGAFGGAGVSRVLGAVAGLGLDVGFFLVSFWALTPRRALPIRMHLPGAIAMAVAWTALKYGGSLYATRVVGRATALYGTVGAVFGLLAILHLAARLFLLAAELSAIRAGDTAGVGRPTPSTS
jgi:YihY family inner membrane protein